ncbi:response regulator, partial [Methylobacterium iners]|uniref:response regulator n=2 Tax=Methylobacterium iners TaxID=418707 RepID=UPI00360FFF6F
LHQPLRVFVVEDEVLLMMQVELYLNTAGHVVADTAVSSCEAIARAGKVVADVALIDLHLADGPTGTEVARFIATQTAMTAVFVTANPKRLPLDFSGAVGVIAKPYTQQGLTAALDFVMDAVTTDAPSMDLPRSLTLAPAYAEQWLELRATEQVPVR